MNYWKTFVVRVVLSVASAFSADALSNIPVYEKDCVILLHGLSRSSLSMKRLEWQFSEEGFTVVNQNYPSRRFAIEELSRIAIDRALASCSRCKNIHFVTHSMGGILLRQYLSTRTIQNLGRVVMLAPPNGGSEIVDTFPLFQKFGGPAYAQLSTNEKTSVPKKLGRVNFELGVIAGERSISPLFSMTIPGKDDGKVSVESAQVEGMKEIRVLPVTHSFITYRRVVFDQAISFLTQGKFISNS